MAGIGLTPQRRSELLQRLLQQGAVQQNPQTGIEAALRLGADYLRQGQAKKLQEQESAQMKRQGAKEAALMSALSGQGATDFQGRPITDAQGQQQPGNVQAQLSQLLTQNPDSAIGQTVAAQQIQQAFTGKQQPKPLTNLGKLEQDVRNNFISPEVAAQVREAEIGGGKVKGPDRAKMEDTLRAEFNKRVASYDNSLARLAQVNDLLDEDDVDPFSVQAALTAFIRSIDDSVVRPSEFQAYQNISGVMNNILNRAAELSGEGPLAKDARENLRRSAAKLNKFAAEGRRANVNFYTDLAENRGLSVGNVLGTNFIPDTNQPPEKTKKPGNGDDSIDEEI